MFYNITILIVIFAFLVYLVFELKIIKRPISRRNKALYNLNKSLINNPFLKTAGQQKEFNQHSTNPADPVIKQPGSNYNNKEIEPIPEPVEPNNIDLSWMDRDEFLKRLENKINAIKYGTFKAFSMKDGLVYFWLETLSDVVIKLAKEENRLNVIAEKKRNIEYSVRVMFDEFVPDFIGKTYPGAKFHLKNIDGKTLNYALLLPLRAEIFQCRLEELEQRKRGRLLKIHEVEPLVRKKT